MPSIALWLALREALHYRVSTLCQIFLVAALAAPLMTILAVQVGVVTDLRHHLERQPENLRLSPSVSVSKDAAWFEAQRRDPRVGFVAPHPYANADELELEHPNGRKLRAALLASGPGDLFLPEGVTPPDIHETVMTASIATALRASVGDVVELVIARPLSGEQRRWPLEVAGISPRGRWASDGLLVHEALLTEAWQWRIGRSSPLLGEDGTAREEPLSFPQFRMFAATLEDLHPLADRLSAEGVAVSGRFAAAEMADAIEHTARIVVLAVGWTATVGAFASLAFAFYADALRMNPALSVLRADGLTAWGAFNVIVFKALVVAVLGWIIGAALWTGTVLMLNQALAGSTLPYVPVARLSGEQLAATGMAALLMAPLASMFAATRVAITSPNEGLNER